VKLTPGFDFFGRQHFGNKNFLELLQMGRQDAGDERFFGLAFA